MKEYYQRNKEKFLEYVRKYRAKNKQEKIEIDMTPAQEKAYKEKQLQSVRQFTQQLEHKLRHEETSVLPQGFYDMWK